MSLHIPRVNLFVCLLLALAGFAVGYGISYFPQKTKVQHLEANMDEMQNRLILSSLRDQLTSTFLEALNRNYGNAQTTAAAFFDKLTHYSRQTDDVELKGQLTTIVNARTQVLDSLRKNDPSATNKIQQLLLQLYRATRKYQT